jgi:hypothetical protein
MGEPKAEASVATTVARLPQHGGHATVVPPPSPNDRKFLVPGASLMWPRDRTSSLRRLAASWPLALLGDGSPGMRSPLSRSVFERCSAVMTEAPR